MVNTVLDKIIYCGLISQLLIGMAWGVLGGDLLELSVQKSAGIPWSFAACL